MARRGGCCTWFNIVNAALGVICGMSAFGVFFFHFKNCQAGMWAFLSGIFAAMTLFIHVLYKTHSLETWYTPTHLHQIRLLGLTGLILGVLGMGAYFGFALKGSEDFPTVDNMTTNHYAMAFMSILTIKWGATLLIFSHIYRKRLLEEYHPLSSPVA